MESFIKELTVSALSLIIGALLIMLSWNYVMPDLFNLETITYWQSIMLHILTGSLFKVGRVRVSKIEEKD